MRNFCAAVFLFCLAGSVFAKADRFSDQCKGLMAAIDSRSLPEGNSTESFGAGYCLGVLSALHLLSEATEMYAKETGLPMRRLICAERFSAKDFAAKVVSHIDGDAALNKQNEVIVSIEVLMTSFPCAGEKPLEVPPAGTASAAPESSGALPPQVK